MIGTDLPTSILDSQRTLSQDVSTFVQNSVLFALKLRLREPVQPGIGQRFLTPPGFVFTPFIGKDLYASGFFHLYKCHERIPDDGKLPFRIISFPGSMSERKVEKGSSRWVDRLRNIQGTAQTYRGNTAQFGVTGNQSDGLMAHWSGRNEKKNIHLMLEQF